VPIDYTFTCGHKDKLSVPDHLIANNNCKYSLNKYVLSDNINI